MAERLPFGEIRPAARPVSAFIQPGQVQTAAAARPSALDRPTGVSTVTTASGGNVQGFNQYAQLADALGPFNRQLTQLAEKGIVSYAKGQIEQGYYSELKNQLAKSTLNLQMQQEQGAANAAATVGQLEKTDPQAADLLRDSNPWRLVGRRRAVAQLAGGEIDNALMADLDANQGTLAGMQPGSPELLRRKAQLSQQILNKYGLSGDEPEAQFYMTPKLNQAWDKYSEKQRSLYGEQLRINTTATTVASMGQALQGYAQKGIPFNGRMVTVADPMFPQLAGALMTAELDKALTLFGGKDRAAAVKEIREQLIGTYGQVEILGNALSFVQGGNPGDKNRPTWGASNPLDILEIRNRGNNARQQEYELGQKAIEQNLDALWDDAQGPGSMISTADPRFISMVRDFRAKAAAAGYRDIDGYINKRMNSMSSVLGQLYGPDPLASQDFITRLDDLSRSDLNSPQAVQALRQQARQAAMLEPTRELQAAKYKEYLDAIKDKQEAAAKSTPGLDKAIDQALLQDLGLPKVKAKVDASKGGGNLFSQMLQGGAGTAAAVSSLGKADVSAFTIRVQNLYLRNAEAKVDAWQAKNPGVPLSNATRNVLFNEAIAETRKSQQYADAYEALTGMKPGEVGVKKVGTGPSQGSQPGAENRGVSRTAAKSLPDSTVKGYAARPVMEGGWLHSELANLEKGKPVSADLYGLARKAGVSTDRYMLEQLRFYPQLDPQGEWRQYLMERVRKARQGQTVSNANYRNASGGFGMVTPYNPLAPGSWLMNMLMPPAAAATLEPDFGGAYRGGRVSTVVGDKGGLAATVSAGEGGWNSVNYGTTGSASRMPLTSMTIGQVEEMQRRGKVFAVGAYQFTPGVLSRARRDAGLSPNDPMTPENQTKLFWGLAMGGKRPRLAAYLRGESNDLRAAHQELSMEWAGVAGPSGRGYYDGDSAGNKASIGAARVRQALIAARRQLSGL